MEDCLQVKYVKSSDGKKLEYAFFGVFDGHGGVHAAKFAKEHLLNEITNQNNFWSDDENQVLKAIKDVCFPKLKNLYLMNINMGSCE